MTAALVMMVVAPAQAVSTRRVTVSATLGDTSVASVAVTATGKVSRTPQGSRVVAQWRFSRHATWSTMSGTATTDRAGSFVVRAHTTMRGVVYLRAVVRKHGNLRAATSKVVTLTVPALLPSPPGPPVVLPDTAPRPLFPAVHDPAIARPSALGAVACPSSVHCLALGTSGTQPGPPWIAELRNGGWSTARAPGSAAVASIRSLVCPADEVCYGVAGSTALTLDHGRTTVTTLEATFTATGLSCPAARVCYASGQHWDSALAHWTPAVATLSLGNWSVTTTSQSSAPAGRLNAISCPTVGVCAAVGDNLRHSPLVSRLIDGTWITTKPFMGTGAFNDVICRDAAQCLAFGRVISTTGESSTVAALTEGSWSLVDAPLPEQAQSGFATQASCPTATWCALWGMYAVDGVYHPFMSILDHGAWTTQALDDVAVNNTVGTDWLRCPAVGFCLLTGDHFTDRRALALTLTDGTWTLLQLPVSSSARVYVGGADCPALGSCVLTGGRVDDLGVSSPFVAMLDRTRWSVRS